METEPPHPEVVNLFKALAIDALTTRFPAGGNEAIRYVQMAVTVAERLSSPVELATALIDLARVYGAHGRWRERLEAALRALAICRERNFDNIPESINILIGAGGALLHSGEYAQAIPYFLEAESLAGTRQAVFEQNMALSLLHQCWFRLDRWPEMVNNLEKMRALQQEYSLERVGTFCFAIALSAAVHALRGEDDGAEALRQEAQVIMTGLSGPPEQWRRGHYY
jgi:tetratricopeptide (TPR) repeat protein